jgi:hypothetical protein
MTIAAILVLFGFLSLVAILFLAKGRAELPSNLATLRNEIYALDIQAFRNLIDRREEDFLRAALEPSQFRTIQRARLLATIGYIVCASRNAAILHQFGEAARHSPLRSVAETGDKLVNLAIIFRLNAFHAMFKLYLALLLPGIRVRKLRVTENYERMTTLVVVLGCSQFGKRNHHAPAMALLST